MIESTICKPRPGNAFTSVRSAFTLIELLVVVVIIAILVAILMPALAKAKYRARHAICMGNLKQVAQATVLYTADNNRFFPDPAGSTFNYSTYSTAFWTWTWRFQNNSAHTSWADYVGGSYGNWKDLTVRNDVMACPQQLLEVPWDTGDNEKNTFYGDKASYLFYIWRRVVDADDDRELFRKNMRRRLGQPLRNYAKRDDKGVFSDAPILSDISKPCNKSIFNIGSHDGQALSNNHTFGGDRGGQVHFAATPAYWGTSTGVGEANFAFDDGSVRQFRSINWFTRSNTSYQWSPGGVGDAENPLIPLELQD